MVYVMSWLPGDFTAIHSHGHTDWGMVYYFGNAEQRSYITEGRKITLSLSEKIEAGSIVPVTGDFVHAMGNLSEKPFLTLHIYGSNSYTGKVTEDSDIYILEKNRIGVSTGPAFLGMNDNLLKGFTEGIETDSATLEDYYTIIATYHKRTGRELNPEQLLNPMLLADIE